MNYSVEIYNSSLILQTICENHSVITWKRKWQGLGNLHMVINQNMPEATYLAKGGIIIIKRDGVYEAGGIIDRIAYRIGQDGFITEEIEVTGNTLDGLLARRICPPPYGESHYEDSGPAETVMKGLVDANLINPEDPTRVIANVVNAADGGAGDVISIRARYSSLTDKLVECAVSGGQLGFEITLNALNEYEFDIIQGVDRSASNGVVSPIILDPDLDNVKAMSFEDNEIGRVNQGYIAGQGEGAERAIHLTDYGVAERIDQEDADFLSGSLSLVEVNDGVRIPSYPALKFDGLTGYVQLPTIGINPSTFNLGVLLTPGPDNADLTTHEQIILDLRGEYNIFISYMESTDATNPNTIRCWMTDGISFYNHYTSVAVGTPVFVSMDFDGTDLIVYLNGEVSGLPVAANAPSANTANNRIGRVDPSATPLWFTGRVSEVQIWDSSLTIAEIDATRPETRTGRPTLSGSEVGLLAYYQMKEGAGTQVNDNSGDEKHGAMVGGVHWIVPKYDDYYDFVHYYITPAIALPSVGNVGLSRIEWEADLPVALNGSFTPSGLNSSISGKKTVTLKGRIRPELTGSLQVLAVLHISGADEKFLIQINANNTIRIGARSQSSEPLQYQDSTETITPMQWMNFEATLDLINNTTTLTVNGEEWTMTGVMAFTRTTFAASVGNAPRIGSGGLGTDIFVGAKQNFELYGDGTLLASWPMDEGTGTAVADETGTYNGTASGGATWLTSSITVETNVNSAGWNAETSGAAITNIALNAAAPGGTMQARATLATNYEGFTPTLHKLSIKVYATENAGLSRREFFRDARDLETLAALISRGNAVIEGQGDPIKFEAEILPGTSQELLKYLEEYFLYPAHPAYTEHMITAEPSYNYRDDWDLGDIVTLRNDRWGVEEDKRVVEVSGELRGGMVQAAITAKLGATQKTLSDVVQEELSAGEVSQRS